MAVEICDGRQGWPATDYRLIEVRGAGKAEADRFCASRLMFFAGYLLERDESSLTCGAETDNNNNNNNERQGSECKVWAGLLVEYLEST